MKKIIENGLEKIEGYEEITEGEKFIYQNIHEWIAIKVNDDYSVFLNGMNKFIVAKKYDNCLSIGSGYVREFDTFEQAKDYALNNKPEL